MSIVKLLAFFYLLGAAVFAFSLLVILLAAVGVETVGSWINVSIPLIGGFVLLMGSKFAGAVALRRVDKR